MNEETVPLSVHLELIQLTITISNEFGMSPFDVLKQQADDVLMFVNYFIDSRKNKNMKQNVNPRGHHNDGFWDFD